LLLQESPIRSLVVCSVGVRARARRIGQPINYSENLVIFGKWLDEYNLPRVDFIKLDVEAMEMEAPEDADKTIQRSRPILLVEKIKSNTEQIGRWLIERGYVLRELGINVLVIHADDKTQADIIPAKPSP
jgi:Methyltransferase FkbM domain